MRHIAIIASIMLASCATHSPIHRELDYVHSRFEYVSDLALYGVRDKWVASYRGDCEDFALVLRERLAARGIESRLLLVVTRTGAPHAVLEAEGMILDNNSRVPRRLERTGYAVWQAVEVEQWH
jgi:predicted transglutaminase-like cysteine proteinase